jgi:signal transduction histidine kinase/CheY-like chemotaxis protein
MSVSPLTSDPMEPRQTRRAKPKPTSLQRRFVLMQAGTMMLALWLIAMALFLDFEIQGRLTASLRQQNATLSLNSQISSSLARVMAAFWNGYSSTGEDWRPRYAEQMSRLQQLTNSYTSASLPEDVQARAELLREQEAQLLATTSQLLNGPRVYANDAASIREVQRLSSFILDTLQRIADSERRRLETSMSELDIYTSALSVLLLGCALFAVLSTVLFRYAHRRHLWEPLEQLRQMVLTVRGGNLDVTAAVPPNVEFGSLVQTFLEMAAELREMRHSLEQKVMERTGELESAQQDLLQAAKLSSLGQLVSGVAHEINNPLTSILGFSEILLARPELPASLRSQVSTIREESLRLKNLVANLSSFARRSPQRTDRLDLRTVLDRLVELRHYQLTASNIQFHYDRSPIPVWVGGDADQLLQVLLNLVVNSEQAIHARRGQGSIWLACGKSNDSGWITVRDDGPGMSAEVRDHLFEPFFTTKPVGRGTGLGLSISHGIIEQHHGKITIQSKPGQGTTVKITLPIAREAPSAAAPSELLAAPSRMDAGFPARVLVVDDEPAVGDLVRQALARHGCETTVLQDSNAFESCLAGASFDLVLCDLKMPGKNGLEILRQLRRLRPELARRFLLMTGNLADAGNNEKELEGVPVLRKPFSLSQLLDAVRSVMASTG